MTSTRRPIRRLTAADFDAAVAGLRITDRSRKLARAVLVDGISTGMTAEAAGVASQSVSQAVGRVYSAHLARIGAPEGWETVVVTVPPALAKSINQVALQARQKHADAAAITRLSRDFAHEQNSGKGRP